VLRGTIHWGVVRFALLLAAVGGCQFRLNPAQGGGSGTDAASDVAVDVMADAQPAPFVLDGLRWTIPCITPLGNQNCSCATAATTTMVTVPGTGTWNVTVRIRGALEGLVYGHGTAPPPGSGWYVGGDTNGDGGDNVYELTISSPAQHYYLNDGPSGNNYSIAFDYMATFPVDGGATATFYSTGQDGLQWANYDHDGQAIRFTGVTTTPDPYDGQFAQLDVVTASPR